MNDCAGSRIAFGSHRLSVRPAVWLTKDGRETFRVFLQPTIALHSEGLPLAVQRVGVSGGEADGDSSGEARCLPRRERFCPILAQNVPLLLGVLI
jgi:hypothetical protein